MALLGGYLVNMFRNVVVSDGFGGGGGGVGYLLIARHSTESTRALLRLERTMNLFGGRGRGGREGGTEGGGRRGGGGREGEGMEGGRGGREG